MESWYQKFLVPPPIPGENRTRVNVSISVTNIMDINEQVFIFSTKTMSDYLPLCHLILVILSCEEGRSLPSSISPCHELAGFKHYFQGETHIKHLHLHLSKTESTKWQASKCWDSFRQLPFLKFCSCSCCLLTELEEPNKYEHPSDKWALRNMDARAYFCQHGKISPTKNAGHVTLFFFSCENQMTGCLILQNLSALWCLLLLSSSKIMWWSVQTISLHIFSCPSSSTPIYETT